jgi:hypothetical protein
MGQTPSSYTAPLPPTNKFEFYFILNFSLSWRREGPYFRPKV